MSSIGANYNYSMPFYGSDEPTRPTLDCGCGGKRCRLSPYDQRHGKYTTYINYHCRCDDCREAVRIYQNNRNQTKREELDAEWNAQHQFEVKVAQAAMKGGHWDRAAELQALTELEAEPDLLPTPTPPSPRPVEDDPTEGGRYEIIDTGGLPYKRPIMGPPKES
jgi:hypothetical protein